MPKGERVTEAAAGGESFLDFLRWRRQRKRVIKQHLARGEALPRVSPHANDILQSDGDAAAWIGHASVLLRMDGKTVLVDPMWRRKAAGVIPRLTPPAIEPAPKPDLVLISHNHYDHMDGPTLRKWRDVPIRVPKGDARWFTRRRFKDVKELDWWDAADVEGLGLTFVPSKHFSGRTPWDRNRSRWGGWVVEGKRSRVYHSGDTGYFDGFTEIADRAGAPDIACLPIGAYEPRWFMRPYHTDPDEAGQAFLDMGAENLLPIHWGTFRLSDEAMDEPPSRIADFFAKRGLAAERLWLGDLGRPWALARERAAPRPRSPSAMRP